MDAPGAEEKPLDVVAVGEMVVDFISVEQTDTLGNATTFRRYLGGSPANVAVYVSRLGGTAAVGSKTGIGAFGKFLKSQPGHHGVITDYLIMDHRTNTTIIFVSSTATTPDVEAFRKDHDGGKIVSLDPNYDPRVWPDRDEAWEVIAEVLPYVNIIKPSLEDARRLFDPNLDDDALEGACLDAFHDLGADVAVMTRSGGVATVSDGASVELVGSLPEVRIENVSGARDAFWSALLISHLEGKSWGSACASPTRSPRSSSGSRGTWNA